MSVSPARSAAFEILLRVEGTSAYASELLHGAIARRLSARDHHLCTELVMGVLRWRGALDQIIARRAGRELKKFDPEVSTSLRLGVYQLLCLDRVPPHAAIHESVELVKRARKRSACGMVNAILRSLKNDGAVLDNDAGHPRWLVERWTSTYGPRPTKQIRDYDQRTPAMAVRVSSADLVLELGREAIELASGRLLRSAFLVNAGEITRTDAFSDHRVTVQDEASQLVALLVGKGQTILDCCAAPGGKTRIMAEQNPQSTIFALDVHPRRARLLRRLVPLGNVRVVAADARSLPLRSNFDRILVDAPCTGTGTLARNPEIKWRLDESDILRLQAYQLAITSAAITHVAPGGRLVYSTCSLEPEENEQVIEKLLAGNPSFHLLSCAHELDNLRSRGDLAWQEISSLTSGPYLRTLPGVHPSDGFFAAIIQRE
jgi:16S rRNA (cytosine967-C5)-methyltransferase